MATTTLFALLTACLTVAYAAKHRVRNNSVHRSGCRHGHLLLGACFCEPGYTGRLCDFKSSPVAPCTSSSDLCFHHHANGVCAVTPQRWHDAQKAELDVWKNVAGLTNDRAADHLEGFTNYAAVPLYLGRVLEIGCGPWTQTKYILDSPGPRHHAEHVTLWEPNADQYIKHVTTCAYASGKLANLPTEIVSLGAEKLDRVEAFDTVIVINVLEHVQNAYEVLQAVWTALAPGGTLVFSDRWWDHYDKNTPVGMTPTAALDHLYHPIRCNRRVFEHFLSHFVPLYRRDDHQAMLKYGDAHGTYFVGMKPL